MDMDLQKTKEARRDRHGKEDSPECTLEPYAGGSSHSKDLPKNDESLDRRSERREKAESASGNQRPVSTKLPYRNGTESASSSASSSSSSSLPASSMPSQARLRGPPPSPEAMAIPNTLDLGTREQRLLRTAKRYPPVTKRTLSELDLPCIMNNINLRMDANFDRDLHFKPDLDGEKGKKKRKEAADYWEAMSNEISIYAFLSAASQDTSDSKSPSDQASPVDIPAQTFEPRLPAMFETLQDVLKTLVPERDHPSVMQNLEVPLLMQQIKKGVLDMVGLAKWLSALLKTHCAPMRDEWADRMVEQITSGFHSQNSREIVCGLQTLFAILEAMKLDVANHQIRAFRVLLIEDTVPFLQEYFRSKMERDNFSVEPSKQWYLRLRQQELARRDKSAITAAADSFRPVQVMFQGLVDLLLQFHSPDGFPETFIFDSERLWQLRSNLQNLINLDICWSIFESYVDNQKRVLSTPAETYAIFRSRIWSLLGETEDCHRGETRWLRNVRNVSLEIARFACAACCGEDSGIVVAADDVISRIEAVLECYLTNDSELFQFHQASLREKLMATTCASARRYLTMSPLAICESQRDVPLPHHMLLLTQRHCDMERIGMRLAHMGVLHWRVWAPILYAREAVPSLETGVVATDDQVLNLFSQSL
ncbi:hypothetical protein ASPZODRAFT_153595 [Penicilliopsis zonata CBS 506.65]|uniref:Uncharacterized protein n=1 Tax=Penicilliopsis zonata CBS 506.65 TaxID=1073090 RepID=A0A1L9SC35_9EURO|nr:hypothetical protein ASPZODRAFT_153595 [Penicilliopsis zonata CBS 506.65]OJJ44702.1 hypothetical protein ASPZODRAFT_153595 [Penicilliopsis zonata CBS 506.65]